MIIQTGCVKHPVIVHSVNQDYLAFYNMEMEYRRQYNYPPISRFILLTISDKNEKNAATLANDIHADLKNYPGFNPNRLFSVVPSPISKISLKYRFQILISTNNIKHSVMIIYKLINKHYKSKEKKICVVCKGKAIGFNIYICSNCETVYCQKCVRTLSNLENTCWACNVPLDPSKPTKPYREETIDKMDIIKKSPKKT